MKRKAKQITKRKAKRIKRPSKLDILKAEIDARLDEITWDCTKEITERVADIRMEVVTIKEEFKNILCSVAFLRNTNTGIIQRYTPMLAKRDDMQIVPLENFDKESLNELIQSSYRKAQMEEKKANKKQGGLIR